MLDSAKLTINDVQESRAWQVEAVAELEAVGLRLRGYGDYYSEDGQGTPVLLEFRNGIPYLVIWADITQEDPTHVISLEQAAEKLRKKD